MATPKWIFYDTETSGLQVAFDQIVQFAAIVTDDDFNPLETYEFKVRWTRDTCPHPLACLTHRLTDRDCAQGLREDQAIAAIHRLVNRPQCINLGYNTLGFDDEVLRFSFFRHLLPPYQHQFAQGCQRADIYPATVFSYVFHRDLLDWPIQPGTGRVSMKLDDIASHNFRLEGRAHDALIDVRATLELAKRLRSHTPCWQDAMAVFHKPSDQASLRACPQQWPQRSHGQLALLIDGRLGNSTGFMAPAICLGQHELYKNQTLWLRLDKAFERLESDDLDNPEPWPFQAFVRKKWGEPPYVLPLNEAHLARMNQDQQRQTGELLNRLGTRPPSWFEQAAQQACRPQAPSHEALDSQAALYAMGFWSDTESRQCARFRHAKVSEKVALLEQMDHPIMRQLAARFLWRYHVDDGEETANETEESSMTLLNDDQRHLVLAELAGHDENPGGPMLTTGKDHAGRMRLDPKTMLEQTTSLLETNDNPSDQAILNTLATWLKSR